MSSTSTPLKIALIGTGRLGSTLALAFAAHGEDVVAVAARRPPVELAVALPSCPAVSPDEAVRMADLVFLTVPDDAIEPIAAALPWRPGQMVVHCSGATEVSALAAAAEAGALTGGFHPLQIFSDPARALNLLPGSAVAIEAADAHLRATLHRLGSALGMRPLELRPGTRAAYHGSANFAASFLLSMLDEALQVWAAIGIPPEQALQALLPLARGTLDAAEAKGLAGAQAGAISRGDAGVVAQHLAALDALGGAHGAIYREMSRRQLKLAREAGTARRGGAGADGSAAARVMPGSTGAPSSPDPTGPSVHYHIETVGIPAAWLRRHNGLLPLTPRIVCMPLDVPTLFVVVTSVTLLMTFWICVMAWGQPTSDALWALALGLFSYAASTVLFATRQFLPQPFSIGGGNVAYSLSLALMLMAVQRFQGAVIRRWQLIAPILIVPLILSPLLGSDQVRSTAMGLLCTAQITLVLRALLDREHALRGRGRVILLVSFGALGLVLLARAIAVGAGWIDSSSRAGGERWLALVFLVAMCAVMSIALGFVYMTMERAERCNYEMAMRDMLTGLSNRRAISEDLQMAVARAQRQGHLLSVLLLDIDHFKRINDSYGHQAGDVVLRSVATTLKSRVRAQDQIGRFGGEEFLVVLPDTGEEGALVLAQALREAVQEAPAQWGAASISLTVSVGVWGGLVTGSTTSESLVAAADAAMYRAKESGRNRVSL